MKLTPICITAKINPDLDGVACALGYADLLNKQHVRAQACIFGTPQSEVQYFIKNHAIAIQTFDSSAPAQWHKFILVDASSMRGMPHVVQANLVQEIVDHRVGEPEKEFPHAKIQNELVGAAATLIVERFMQANILPDYNNAKLLYGAIFHNSLNFITSNTTERDKLAVQFLERNFDLNQALIDEMFQYASQEILRDLYGSVVSDAKQFGEFNFYQLVMSDVDYKSLEKELSKIVVNEDIKHPCAWSMVNIVDVNKKVSYLFVPSTMGQEILTRGLGCTFIDSWAMVPATLRKEIMPKITLESR